LMTRNFRLLAENVAKLLKRWIGSVNFAPEISSNPIQYFYPTHSYFP
jgi:hypothetical protein